MSMLVDNDPFTGPSFPLSNRIRRATWALVYALLFRPSPRPLHAWRALLLRAFGAQMGERCHVYPGAKIWAPWNLQLGRYVGIADNVVLYNMDVISIGDHAVISQGAHLCGGTHDYDSRNFQLVAKPISIGARAWICADAFIHPGITIAEGVVIGARSVVHRNISESWTVCAGHPCVKVGDRARLA